MKQKIIVITIAAVLGLAGGYFIFSGNAPEMTETHNHSETTTQNQMWTCSMHPQVMQNESGSCPLCGMDLIPAESDGAGLDANQFKMSANAMALANIQTTKIGSNHSNLNSLQLSGKIVENESMNAVQSSYFNGRIEDLFINTTGEKVTKGQKLATIYSPELVAAQQELLTSASFKSTQPALYQAVRNKLKLWKLSEGQINSIEQSGKVTEFVPIYANTSGTVTHKMVENGDYVKAGQPLYKIANLSSIWAEFDAYEAQISLLKIGQGITITNNAYKNQSVETKISFIDPTLNAQTRTVVVRADLANPDGLLKPGMFVEGFVKEASTYNKSQIIIPSSAVLWTGKRSVVYVKTDVNSPVFEMREVTLGLSINDMYFVTSGLSEGETIVTNGAFTVDAAAQLNGKKSMMNQSVNNDNVTNVPKVDVTESFQTSLQLIFKSYIDLKNALVNDDPAKVQNAAKTLSSRLNSVSDDTVSQTKKEWSKLKMAIQQASKKIYNTEQLSDQREVFIALSVNMTTVVKRYGVGQTVYNQYCPMADNNRGASWLSLEESIRNPYFGQSMLKCGSVMSILN